MAPSLSEPAAPHEDRSDCWFETSALVGEASNPDEKKEVPIKLFQVQYDPSQPPPGSNLDKPGKRLVHFIAVAFGPQLVPRREYIYSTLPLARCLTDVQAYQTCRFTSFLLWLIVFIGL